LGTFGQSHAGQKRLRSRFIVAAIAMTAMIFAAATAPKTAKDKCNMEFPRQINSHPAEFVSNL